MPNWKKVLTSGSAGELSSLFAPSITGSLLGTASFATSASRAISSSRSDSALSASFATTASYILNAISSSFSSTSSYVNTLNQNVLITGSLTVGATAVGANENTLIIGPAPVGGTGEGGQILLQAVGGTYTSASMLDNYQNRFRILRGTNASSDAEYFNLNLHSGQVTFNKYTGSGAFSGTAAGYLAFDSSGNILTTAGVAASAGGSNTQIQYNNGGALGGVSTLTFDGTTLRATGSFTGSFTGSLFGTASWSDNAVSASFASTASFITASNVFGPYGSNSVATASYAIYAETASRSDITAATQILVLNQSGYTINKGLVVHITASGNSSDIPRIVSASYESDSFSANTLGISVENITNGSQGYVITEGVLTGIDTSLFQSGQLIYLGAQGTITGSAPVAPLHSVRLGQVIREQSVNGSIHVRVDNGYELGELHDTLDTTTSASYGDLLVKSGSVWTNSRQLTGSYGLTGSLSATSFTGSLQGTASWAQNAVTASFITTAQTASYVLNAISSSFASTASFLNSTTNAFIQGGNSFGTTATLGTNDTQNLALETNGGVRMFISSSGNIGIGTTTPSNRLHVSSNGNIFTLEGTDHVYQQFYPQGIAAGRFAYIGFPSSGSKQLTILNENGTGDLALGTAAATRMFISASGNVGIGTITPATALHVQGNDKFVVTSQTSYPWGNSTTIGVGMGTYSTYNAGAIDFRRWVGSATSHSVAAITQEQGGGSGWGLSFKTDYPGTNSAASSTRMYISPTGNVGVGITTPSASLHINNTTSGNSFLVEDDTNPDATPFVIGANGNVSIGTGSVGTYKLDVTDVDPQLRVYASTNNRALRLYPGSGTIEADNTSFYLNRVSNTNILLGFGGGNVGVGSVASPATKLHVSHSGAEIARFESTASTGNAYVSFYGNGVAKGYVGYGSPSTNGLFLTNYLTDAGASLSLGTSGAVRLSISSSGNVGIGTTTPTLGTLQVAGNVYANAFTGSLQGTSSWANNAITASHATSISPLNQNVVVTGSLTITNDLIVQGSASIQYVTSSQLNIFDNIISVNTLTPSIRFGGLAVIDSGSSPQQSGSLLFDSQNNQWIFVHQSAAAAAVTSSMLIMGPQTFNNLGNETSLTTNRLPKASGADLGEHLGDSNITDTGTLVSINSNSHVTGSLIVTAGITGSLFGTGSWARNAVTASTVLVSGVGATAGNFYPTFITTNNASPQSAELLTDSSLAYDPFNNILYTTASLANTASYVNPLNQDVIITGSVVLGNVQDPMLLTTTITTTVSTGFTALYNLPTASYDTAFFEYSARSGSNARAGSIMAIRSGSSVIYTETTTTDFGSTAACSIDVVPTVGNMTLRTNTSTLGWTIKTIVRSM